MLKKTRNRKKIMGVVVVLLVVATALFAPNFVKQIEKESLKQKMVVAARKYVETHNLNGSVTLTNDFLIKENVLNSDKFSQYSYVAVTDIDGENYYEPIILENQQQALNSGDEFIASLASNDVWEQLDYISMTKTPSTLTNGDVLVQILFNMPIVSSKVPSGWTLSNEKLLTKTFSQNSTETITVYAINSKGGETTRNVRVTVSNIDKIPPVISGVTNNQVFGVNDKVNITFEEGATAIVGGTQVTSPYAPVADGLYQMAVTDEAGNSVNINFYIDTEKPVISLKGNQTETVEVGSTYTDTGVDVTDTLDANIVSKLNTVSTVDMTQVGTYTVTYTVTDHAGNIADAVVRTVNVVDTEKPVITLKGENPFILELGQEYVEPGYTVSDNYYTDLENNVVVTGTVNKDLTGTYMLYYNVTDPSNNSSNQKVRTIRVLDKSSLHVFDDKIAELKKEDYTTDSWEKLEDALKLPETTEDEVAAKADAIGKAIDGLKEAGRTQELTDALNAVKKRLNDKKPSSDYVSEYWTAVENKITEAEAEKLNSKLPALIEEINGLIDDLDNHLVDIDKSELDTIQLELDAAKESGDYTDKSISDKQELINNAKDTNKLSEYETALQAVKDKQLEAKNIEEDKLAELDTIKEILGNLKESDYTPESWKKVNDQVKKTEEQTLISKFDEEFAKINLNDLALIPVIKVTSITTTNSSDKYTKPGDIMTLVFTSNDELDLDKTTVVMSTKYSVDSIVKDETKVNTYVATYTITKNNYGSFSYTITPVTTKGATTSSIKKNVPFQNDQYLPEITLNSDSVVTIEKGKDYVAANVTAIDEKFSGDITNRIVKATTLNGETVDGVNTNIVGIYTETYKVTDLAGNSEKEVVTRTVHVIDKDALKEKLESLEDLKESDYTEESWNDLTDAKNLPETTQELIDNKIKAIDEAVNALEPKAITDSLKADLQASKNRLEAKKPSSDYVPEYWTSVENKITEAENEKLNSKLPDLITEINSLIDDLDNHLEVPDKSELDVIEAELNSDTTKLDYTAESIKAKQDLIDVAKAKNKISEYSAALEAVKAATLTLKDVDKSELDAIEAELNLDTTKLDYTAESIKAKQDLIDVARAKDKVSEYNEALAAVKALTLTLKGVDKSELDTIQTELNAAKESGDYTDESIKIKQDLIDVARAKDKISEYSIALEAVKKAALALKGVDKSELDAIQTELNAAKESGDYTNESIKIKQDLIDEAKDAKKISEYNEILDAIRITKLVPIPFDKVSKENLIGSLVESDYTTDSWSAFESAIDTALAQTVKSKYDAEILNVNVAKLNLALIPVIKVTSITTTNSSDKYTKPGDVMTLVFTSNDELDLDKTTVVMSTKYSVDSIVKDETKVNTYVVTYTITKNNYGSFSYTITPVTTKGATTTPTKKNVPFKNDQYLPEITLNSDTVVTIEKGKEYIEANVTANDEKFSGDVTSRIVKTITLNGETVDGVNTNIVGIYTETYKVTDLAGNSEKEVVTRTVHVIDKDALKEKLESLEDLKESDYTEESWNDLTDAKNLPETTQELIDNKIKAIDEAVNALEPKAITDSLKADLQAAKNRLEAKKPSSDYVPEYWTSVENKITEAENEKLNSKLPDLITEINSLIDDLDNHIAPFDKATKEELIGSLAESDYTVESWKNFTDTIDAALAQTLKSEYDAELANVDTAKTNLVAATFDKATKEELIGSLVESDYTVESWENFTDAIDAALNQTLKSEYEKALINVNTAKTNLVAATFDKATKEDLIGSLVESDYTTDSWSAFESAIDTALAQTVKSKYDAELVNVNTAKANLALIPVINVTSITTTNSSDKYAKPGDVMTLVFTSNDELDLDKTTVLISDKYVVDSIVKDETAVNTYIVTYTITKSTSGKFKYTISPVTTKFVTTSVTEGRVPFQNDTVLPVITLPKEDQVVTIEKGNDYVAANVTAFDEKYSKDITSIITTTTALNGETVDRVNTEVLGIYTETYNVTDFAGNEAIAVQRTVHVVDKDVLKEKLKELENLKESDYTEESWKDLANAIALPETTQVEIDDKASKISGAINALKPIEFSYNDLAVIQAQLDLDAATGDYTEESIEAKQNAINAAKEIKLISEYKTALENLNKMDLDPKPIEQSKLDALNAYINTLSNLKEADYTPESWKKVNDQVNKTKEQILNSKFDEEFAKINLDDLALVPVISNIRFETTNNNNKYAKVDDSVILIFTSNDELDLEKTVVTLGSKNVKLTRIDDTLDYKVTIKVDDTTVEGNLVYTINPVTTKNATVDEIISDSSSIIIDRTAPKIELGDTLQNIGLGKPYNELGVTVSDNYSTNLEASIDSTNVNTLVVGTYEVIYTAVDGAGNETIAKRSVKVNPITTSNVVRDSNNCEATGTCYNKVNENNYVWYSGYLWRIVSVNDDNTMKLITEDSIAGFSYDDDSSDFNNSIMEEWLRYEFYPTLNNANTIVVDAPYCNNVTKESNASREDCSYGELSSSIGLLTLDEYNILGGKASFLNTKDYFYTMTRYKTKSVWVIDHLGNAQHDSVTSTFAVRPVITTNQNITFVSGNGSKENPYRLNGDSSATENTLLNQRYAGEYVMFANQKWRIIESGSSNKTKLMLDSFYKENNNIVTIRPNEENKVLDINSDIINYLNNDLYNSMFNESQRNMMAPMNLFVAPYHFGANPRKTSLKVTGDIKDAFVSLNSVGGILSGFNASTEVIRQSSWLMNYNDTNDLDWYTSSAGMNNFCVTNDCEIRSELTVPDAKRAIKPVIALNSSVVIYGGDGTFNHPYIVEKSS